MPSQQQKSFLVHGVEYGYTLRRSRRARHILLHVDISGAIELVVPWHASFAAAEAFLQSKASWVVRSLAKQMRLKHTHASRRLESGEIVPCFGDEVTLHCTAVPTIPRARAVHTGNILHLSAGDTNGIRRALESWYIRQARTFFMQESGILSESIGKHIAAIRITNAKTQWGSCNARKRTLSFNWRLALAPREVAAYVAAHEVAHMLQPNHSKRFWKQLATLDPSYMAHKTWLKDHGHTLVL